MIEMSLEFKYAQGKWTLVTVNSRMIPDKQWFSNFTLDCVMLSVYDWSPMNEALLNDQQQLNVGFDYDSLPDVLALFVSPI